MITLTIVWKPDTEHDAIVMATEILDIANKRIKSITMEMTKDD